jgi:hypothetical protein
VRASKQINRAKVNVLGAMFKRNVQNLRHLKVVDIVRESESLSAGGYIQYLMSEEWREYGALLHGRDDLPPRQNSCHPNLLMTFMNGHL